MNFYQVEIHTGMANFGELISAVIRAPDLVAARSVLRDRLAKSRTRYTWRDYKFTKIDPQGPAGIILEDVWDG